MTRLRSHWRTILGVTALVLISIRETVTLLHLTRWSELLDVGAATAILGSLGIMLKAWVTPTKRDGDQGRE